MKRYEQKNVSSNPYEPWQELREDSEGEWVTHSDAAAEIAKRDARITALEEDGRSDEASITRLRALLDGYGQEIATQSMRIAELEAESAKMRSAISDTIRSFAGRILFSTTLLEFEDSI